MLFVHDSAASRSRSGMRNTYIRCRSHSSTRTGASSHRGHGTQVERLTWSAGPALYALEMKKGWFRPEGIGPRRRGQGTAAAVKRSRGGPPRSARLPVPSRRWRAFSVAPAAQLEADLPRGSSAEASRDGIRQALLEREVDDFSALSLARDRVDTAERIGEPELDARAPSTPRPVKSSGDLLEPWCRGPSRTAFTNCPSPRSRMPRCASRPPARADGTDRGALALARVITAARCRACRSHREAKPCIIRRSSDEARLCRRRSGRHPPRCNSHLTPPCPGDGDRGFSGCLARSRRNSS